MKKIIVIDDDPVMLLAIREALNNQGYEVFATSDAEDALDTLKQEQYDLIITDIMMPYMSGIEVVSNIKSNKTQTPIIIISALEAEEIKMLAVQEGATAFLQKPLQLNLLVEKVNTILK